MSRLEFPEQVDDQHRRRLLWAMPVGIYVLGTAASGSFHLMTHSLATQAATEPCVLAVAVERTARTHQLLEDSGVATLSVLGRSQRELVRRFVKPDLAVQLAADGSPTSIADVPVRLAPSGAPYLAEALGCFDLRRVGAHDFESHTLFLLEVTGVAASEDVLHGAASARYAEVLRMEDTKMNYGG